jgi:hypothetical protein
VGVLECNNPAGPQGDAPSGEGRGVGVGWGRESFHPPTASPDFDAHRLYRPQPPLQYHPRDCKELNKNIPGLGTFFWLYDSGWVHRGNCPSPLVMQALCMQHQVIWWASFAAKNHST